MIGEAKKLSELDTREGRPIETNINCGGGIALINYTMLTAWKQ